VPLKSGSRATAGVRAPFRRLAGSAETRKTSSRRHCGRLPLSHASAPAATSMAGGAIMTTNQLDARAAEAVPDVPLERPGVAYPASRSTCRMMPPIRRASSCREELDQPFQSALDTLLPPQRATSFSATWTGLRRGGGSVEACR